MVPYGEGVTDAIVMNGLKNNALHVLSKVLQMITDLCETVVDNPLLLVGVSLLMIGFVVGICKRLISTF